MTLRRASLSRSLEAGDAADGLLEAQDCFLTCKWAAVTHRTGPKSVKQRELPQRSRQSP